MESGDGKGRMGRRSGRFDSSLRQKNGRVKRMEIENAGRDEEMKEGREKKA